MRDSDRIKERLRAAETPEELKAVWLEEHDAILVAEPTMRTQILNLKNLLKDNFLRKITNQGAG